MAERTCDVGGEKADVSGGKTCENSHFVCRRHLGGGILSGPASTCPLCKKPLR